MFFESKVSTSKCPKSTYLCEKTFVDAVSPSETSKTKNMKRRSFLLKSATTAFGFQVVSSHVLRAAEGQNTPNNKIRIAAIGCGGRGGANLGAMAGEDIVALCDVDDRNAAHSFKKFPKAKRFKDFRKMYDAMEGQIDAVLVATPDHTHAVAIMGAIGRGKHVYSEKPLAHSVAEVRTLQKAALDKKVITQVGNQGHSSDHIRFFCELVWAGAIGKGVAATTTY